MSSIDLVEYPDSPAMDRLCEQLAAWSERWKSTQDWPGEALRLCGDAGVYRWFLPEGLGGFGWDERSQTSGYLRLSGVDLTTTFIITQYMGACRRIAGSERQYVADQWLERLIRGQSFATVGISHLTTSRQHLGRPALQARATEGGWRLTGNSPWVTGAAAADLYVVGATLDDGREILLAPDAKADGITPGQGFRLVALSASKTDRVEFDDVFVPESGLLAGPIENVMKTGTGAGTGGLQTSTLAIGVSRAAVNYLLMESERRKDLVEPTEELAGQLDELEQRLLGAASGEDRCSASDIRASANRMVLRTTQAALVAAKGAGYVEGHPVGRWCREALFFLVWSCPQPISQEHLCELAGIAG